MNNTWYEMDMEIRNHRQELVEQMRRAHRASWFKRRAARRAADG